jgi:hypothetical protein
MCSCGCDAPPETSESWNVYLAKISGGSILIDTESNLKGRKGCTIAGGGLCKNDGSDYLVQYAVVDGPFKSEDEAIAAYCAKRTAPLVPNPVAHGVKTQIYGGNYWVDTAPDCPSPPASASGSSSPQK